MLIMDYLELLPRCVIYMTLKHVKIAKWSGVKDNTTYHWPPAHWRSSTTSEVQRYNNWQRSRAEMILSTPHQSFFTRCMRLVVFTSTSEKSPSLQNTPCPIFRFSRVWWHCYPSSPCHSRQAFESLQCKNYLCLEQIFSDCQRK